MKFSSSRRGIRVIRVRANRVKMTEKWGEMHGKWDLVRVSGVFYFILFYFIYFAKQ